MVNYCKSAKCLVGKTAVITGANAGIGYITALDLAKRGCRVILACRNEERANKARDQIIASTGNPNVVVKLVNLDSMESVKELAKNILETEDRLDLLINNAGGLDMPDKITADGFQLQMAVNYFSHFLLTNLLLDLLKKSAPSRVVNVSSAAGAMVRSLNLKNLDKYGGTWSMYNRTKLCNILFTQELAKRLEGSGVTTYSLHPGAVHTEFFAHAKCKNFLASKFFITAEEGTQTTLYVALEDGIEKYNGRHFDNCKVVKNYRGARDPEKAKALWELSEERLGMKQ